MTKPRTVHSDLLRVFLLTLLWLFTIPAVTLIFTQYALRTEDAAFLTKIETRIAGDSRLSLEERTEATAYYRAHPLSSACSATAPEDRKFHEQVCAPYEFHWQFHWADRVAFWALVFGAALLVVALVLGALAFTNRGLRYASFVAGWRLMTASSAAEVLLQGAMLLWLSFWLTAYFWERFSVKLVGIAGLVAALAVFLAIKTMFEKSTSPFEIEGELLGESEAPRLWQRIRDLAGRVGTAPPDHIVAGIDANFFVTETPCVVGGKTLTGRTLFVSIPLLRVMETAEADAVLAHELAHLGGGDTKSSAALGPKLQQFDRYTWKMRTNGLTIVAHHLLRLYRMIFEFALAKDSREREYTADRTAARLTAGSAVVDSLVKISAYSSYRNSVENKLYAQDREHVGQLGIAGFVAAGLRPYAASPDFIERMKTVSVPHPYDSHPRLAERMQNVGHDVPESDYGAIVMRVPQATWADEISTASAIEERLWGEYEQRFAESHEVSLAYRYEPASEEELALVLRHFPPLVFGLAKEQRFEVSHRGLHSSANAAGLVGWDEVKALTFSDSNWSPSLVVTHHEKGVIGARKTTLKLRGLGKHTPAFKNAVGRYWQRHQIMRAQQQERREAAT